MTNSPQVSLGIYCSDLSLKQIKDFLVMASAQRFNDFELILILEPNLTQANKYSELGATDQRILVIEDKRATNKWSAYNAIIDVACGKYIKFCTPTEIWPERFLAQMVEIAEAKHAVSLVTARDSKHDSAYNSKESELPFTATDSFHQNQFYLGQTAICASLRDKVNFIGSAESGLFKNPEQKAKYDNRFKFVPELDFWYQILQIGNLFTSEIEIKHSSSAIHEATGWMKLSEFPQLAIKHCEQYRFLKIDLSVYAKEVLYAMQSRSNMTIGLVSMLEQLFPSEKLINEELCTENIRTDAITLMSYAFIAHAALPQFIAKQNKLDEIETRYKKLVEHQKTLLEQKENELAQEKVTSQAKQTELEKIIQSRFWKVTSPPRKMLQRIRSFTRLDH